MNSQEIKKLENKIFKKFEKYFSKNNKKTDTIIVGISGGPDSIFLLHLLFEFSKNKNIKIVTAHINHLLRKEGFADEAFVKTRVKLLNTKTENKIIFHSKKSDINKISQEKKQGIEETGRKIRYQFFSKLAKKYKANFIITGHHADDNFETIILNLTRGAGLKGLAGMQEKEALLFRPLLNISKNQITSYLKTKKISYRTDKSNFSQIYKRNVIRAKIVPELKKINPTIVETTSKNSENLREINDFLEKEAEKWIKKNSLNKENTKLNATSLRNAHKALQKAIIRTLYKNLVGNTKNIETVHVDEILEIIGQNIGNKTKKLGKLVFSIKSNIIKVKISGEK